MKLSAILLLGSALFLMISLPATTISLHTRTPSKAAAPTATPMPLSLPITEASLRDLARLQKAMASSPDCKLPCFWGFRPRETKLPGILSYLGISRNNAMKGKYTLESHLFHSAVFPTPTPAGIPPEPTVSIEFVMDGEDLAYMEVYLREPSRWLPAGTLEMPQLLREIQQTPDIYILMRAVTQIFSFAIVYNTEGIVVEYVFRFKPGQFVVYEPGPAKICPRLEQSYFIHLCLQSSKEKTLVEDRIYPAMPPGSIRSDKYRREIKSVTGQDAEAFRRQIIAEPDSCIETLPIPELLKHGQEF